ncbi:MAG: hypothetical protein ACQEP5_05755 [Actinomycetota bacterium]
MAEKIQVAISRCGNIESKDSLRGALTETLDLIGGLEVKLSR